MQNSEADVIIGLYLQMALLNGTSQRLKVHTHLCHLNFDGSYEVLGSSCAVLLSIEQALQDFSLAFELVLRLDFI